MSATDNAQVLGASVLGVSALPLLGVSVETSVILGLLILFVLLGFYLLYKFRNRNLR